MLAISAGEPNCVRHETIRFIRKHLIPRSSDAKGHEGMCRYRIGHFTNIFLEVGN
jgi:hypothetical protein